MTKYAAQLATGIHCAAHFATLHRDWRGRVHALCNPSQGLAGRVREFATLHRDWKLATLHRDWRGRTHERYR